MDHINEDKLLEYALETLDNEAERAEIEGHLKSCPDCREKLSGLNGDIEAIGGIKGEFGMTEMYYPRKKRSIGYAFLKAAALLILGFVAGLVVSGNLHREPVSISGSYLKVSPPADSVAGYTACDATEITPEYYVRLIDTE